MARMLLAAALVAFCALALVQPASAEFGHASWYALTSRTASGENCDPTALTAAHRSLPFGTKVKVENVTNGRWVVVRINDRGPFVRGRIIDLTRAAARRLDFLSRGTTKVRLTIISAEPTGPSDKSRGARPRLPL
jgi:rare lipoprotein A